MLSAVLKVSKHWSTLSAIMNKSTKTPILSHSSQYSIFEPPCLCFLLHNYGPCCLKQHARLIDWLIMRKLTDFNAVQQRTKLRTDECRTSVRRVYVKPNVVLSTWKCQVKTLYRGDAKRLIIATQSGLHRKRITLSFSCTRSFLYLHIYEVILVSQYQLCNYKRRNQKIDFVTRQSHQTSSPMPPSSELDETLRRLWLCPIGPLCKTWHHPQNRKYIAYCVVVRVQKRAKATVKMTVQKTSWSLDTWFVRYNSRHTNRQTDRQTDTYADRRSRTK